MASQQERSNETTSAIMKATMKMCLIKSIDTVTVRDICSEAGISIGAFYHHFASREELLQRTFEVFDRTLSQQLDRRCIKENPLEALEDILMFQIRFMSREGAGLLSHYYCTLLNDPSSHAVSFDRSYYRAVQFCLQRLQDAQLLLPDCRPRELTNYCITFMRGCLIDWCLHGQSYDIVSHVSLVLPIFLRGFIRYSD